MPNSSLFSLWLTIMSVSSIILISGGNDIFWYWDILPSFTLSVTRERINEGALVFSRVIGGMSSMIFIALATLMTDICVVLHQCRVPEVVIDLMMIIYRTIFILIVLVIQIYHAQVMRLGYSQWKESIHSVSSLCGSAFIASWYAGDDLIRAMDARCYDGKFALLGEKWPVKRMPCLAVLVFLTVSAMVVIAAGTMPPDIRCRA